MSRLVVGADDPRAADVRELLTAHLAYANQHTPPGHVHALDLAAILDEHISFFSVRRHGELLGVGALRHLNDSHAEIKSMHTAATARRNGVGRAMVEHLVDVARARGYRRLSLETGTMSAFAASRALYASAGFEVCEPFADYPATPHSVCMTLDLMV